MRRITGSYRSSVALVPTNALLAPELSTSISWPQTGFEEVKGHPPGGRATFPQAADWHGITSELPSSGPDGRSFQKNEPRPQGSVESSAYQISHAKVAKPEPAPDQACDNHRKQHIENWHPGANIARDGTTEIRR